MGWIAKDLPTLIFQLLPGFIAAGIYYTLTAHPKTSEFERVVQSLIFTSFIRFATNVLKPFFFKAGKLHSFGPWDSDVEFNWSILLAVVLGVLFALSANKDAFHGVARRLGWSTRTSHPSEWYSVFSNNDRYILLYLKGKRRLRGWAEEWPDQPERGHFVIVNPEWILSDDQVAPLYQVERFMIPATDVEMVEFLKRAGEINASDEELERVRNLLLEAQTDTGDSSHGSESTSAGT